VALLIWSAPSYAPEPTVAFYILLGANNRNETPILRASAVAMAKAAIQSSYPGALVDVRPQYDAGVFREPLPDSIRQVHYLVLSHSGVKDGLYGVKGDASGNLVSTAEMGKALVDNHAGKRTVDVSFFGCQCGAMDTGALPGSIFGAVSGDEDTDVKDVVRFFGDLAKPAGFRKSKTPSGKFPLTAMEMYRAYQSFRAATPDTAFASPWLAGVECPAAYGGIKK